MCGTYFSLSGVLLLLIVLMFPFNMTQFEVMSMLEKKMLE
jgi:hypothetical protein